MFEDSYLVEVNLEAAEILKECAWRQFLAVNGVLFSPPFWLLSDMVSRIQYWSIMYYTHGGF